jgi:hypothetical protein
VVLGPRFADVCLAAPELDAAAVEIAAFEHQHLLDAAMAVRGKLSDGVH